MKQTDLFREIGNIDVDLIAEADKFFSVHGSGERCLDQRPGFSDQQHGFFDRQPGFSDRQPGFSDQRHGGTARQPGFSDRQHGGTARRFKKRGLAFAALFLAVVLALAAPTGSLTSLAGRIRGYLSGIVRTRDDSLDLGFAKALHVGRVQGLDENLCKHYSSFSDLEADLGLDLLEYSGPYSLALGGGPRPILLQYFDYNESAFVSVPVAADRPDGETLYFSYEMDFLTGGDGTLGAFTFDGEGLELESYTHPALDIPVAIVKTADGSGYACFIYENVRYTVMEVGDVAALKEIVGLLR